MLQDKAVTNGLDKYLENEIILIIITENKIIFLLKITIIQ